MSDDEHVTDEQYRRKIKTRDELLAILGPYPRDRTVVMCHGTFDLVHPGHIRHLMYAKSKGDVLVASLTSDAHIAKANYRPFVPQELRAMNLAALEAVDYVIVDEQPTPLDNIAFLQPDFFAKGYEYSESGVHPRTREEMTVLGTYGGEILFTPGDVVFSSSRFIEEHPPNLSFEKLHVLLDSEGIGFDDLREGLAACRGRRVHVLGDTIVDTYVFCTPIGSSASKTPTISLKHEQEIDYAGGAAVVARHLQAAGAQVTFSTVLGDDDAARFVRSEMESSGVRLLAAEDPTRPTTRKANFIAGGYRLLKVDHVDNRSISDRILELFRSDLEGSDADVVVFSDFRHGVFSRETIPQLSAAIRDGAFRVADSQVASRWGNILDFAGFDLITPNEREARFALADQDSVVRPLALELYRRAGCGILILKLGERGIIAYREASDEVRAFFTVDSFADPVVDPVGAGDALLAYSSLALRATGSSVIASVLGAVAAGIACEHEGNTPVTPDQVLAKLEQVERRLTYA
jgi:rfaE bifunctional protein kinase chain/domain